MEAPGRNPEGPVKNTPTCTVSLCLLHGIRNQNEEEKKVGLACSRMTHLFVRIFFAPTQKRDKLLGRRRPRSSLSMLFFFFYSTQTSDYFGPTKNIPYVGHQGICSAALGVALKEKYSLKIAGKSSYKQEMYRIKYVGHTL